MGQENSLHLSVQLLGCILIARGMGVEQKQVQRFLEFVDCVNSILPHLAGDVLAEAFGLLLDLEPPKYCPAFSPDKRWCCGYRAQPESEQPAYSTSLSQ